MDSICTCQDPSVNFTEYGGKFTKTKVSQLPGLICIDCKNCVAVKSSNDKTYQDLEKLLGLGQDSDLTRQGWVQAEAPDDFLKHKILNFAQYRINEPPNKENFECNYSEPMLDKDQVYLLWHQSKASGFITIRTNFEVFDDPNLRIIDTVYIRKSARGNGYLSRFLKSELSSHELGFSEPISNSMLVVLLKLLKKHPEHCERIWLVNEESGERQILCWSAMKLARQRQLDLKTIMN